jgi:hypothetical protein
MNRILSSVPYIGLGAIYIILVAAQRRQKPGNGNALKSRSPCNLFRQNKKVKLRKADQGCQIFLCSKYQNGENIPNGSKMDEMSIKLTNIFLCKTLQKLPFLV